MNARRDRSDLIGRWQRTWVLAVFPWLVGGDPELVRVNHDLGPGESVFGWGFTPGGERMIYAVDRHDFDGRQLFSVSVDGSQDALALTDPLPARRTISNWAIGPDGQHVAFVADLTLDERSDLYSVTTDGARQVVKLSHSLAGGEEVLSLEFTPDGKRVLYLVATPYSGRNALYSAPVDGSQPAVLLHTPEPGVYGFLAFHGTTAGQRVIYWSKPERLLSAPVDGSAPPIDVSPGLAPHNAYRLSPNGKWLVYYSPSAGGSDLFSVPADGSAPPRALFFRHTTGQATEPTPVTYDAIQISSDSRLVAGITSGFREIRVAPIDGSGPPTVLADPPGLFRSSFRLTGDGRLVFEATRFGSLYVQGRGLYTAPLDGSSHAQEILGLRGDPRPLKHELSRRDDVVFVGLDDGWELFTVPAGGGTAVQLNPPLVPGGEIDGANIVNSRCVEFGQDGLWLLYAADQEQNNVRELFAARCDGSLPARKMSGPLPADGDVFGFAFAPDSRRALYGMWTTTKREVFTWVLEDDALDAADRDRGAQHAGAAPPQPAMPAARMVDDPRVLRSASTPDPADPDGVLTPEASTSAPGTVR